MPVPDRRPLAPDPDVVAALRSLSRGQVLLTTPPQQGQNNEQQDYRRQKSGARRIA